MTKDQIDEIAFKVARESNLRLDNACGCSTCRERDDPPRIKSFTHALLAELDKVQEPIGWYTEEHLTDKSATTCNKEIAKRWVDKGWPVFPLHANQLPQPDLVAEIEAAYEAGYSAGYDACLGEQEE